MSKYIFVTNIFEYSNIQIYSSHSVPKLEIGHFSSLTALSPYVLYSIHVNIMSGQSGHPDQTRVRPDQTRPESDQNRPESDQNRVIPDQSWTGPDPQITKCICLKLGNVLISIGKCITLKLQNVSVSNCKMN